MSSQLYMERRLRLIVMGFEAHTNDTPLGVEFDRTKQPGEVPPTGSTIAGVDSRVAHAQPTAALQRFA